MEKISLILSNQNADKMIRHAASCFPSEACGLLGGKDHRLLQVFSVKNIEKDPKRFQMDPVQQVQTFKKVEEMGLELLAIYHSHPDGSSQLSQIDIDNFFYPGVYSIILYINKNIWKIKAFKVEEKELDEIPLIIRNIS